jgi:endogenous inhibitor of DNA gyrase (YacG/DUF329 family)
MIRPQTCPICNKEISGDRDAVDSLFPFCSERCRMVDLYRWSEGKYAIVEPLSPDQIAEVDQQQAGDDLDVD